MYFNVVEEKALTKYPSCVPITKFKKLSSGKFNVRALTLFIDNEKQLFSQLFQSTFVSAWTSPPAHEERFFVLIG